ncbi:MAG TPA: cell surface protein SprA [Candidatus Marinimicrobia bacterium]|nr:cell surface protein SprA [Candidatus Neomarinimicrobiota bacterium]
MGFFVQSFAADREPDVFPLKIDWLSNRYTPANIESKRGLSLISPDYVTLNQNILKVQFPGMKVTNTLDKSGQHFIFYNDLNGAPVLTPIGIPVASYFDLRQRLNWHNKLVEVVTAKPADTKAASDKLELIGADIAGQHVALRVSGNININGRLQTQKRSQVSSSYAEGTSTSFIVDQKQQLNIEGKIGDRISILVDQDSERDFDFENAMKIIYTGKEDEIVQKVEAGNVALSLPGTQFVTFSGKNNGLFGLKALMKFGGVDVTAIASVEKGKKEKLSIDGGAQTSNISIKEYEYRRNLYFFLDTLFRDNMYRGYQFDQLFHADPRGKVTDLQVYKSQTIETAGCAYGTAYVDPRDTTLYKDYSENRIFKLLELNKDYYVDVTLGYIRMTTQVQDGEILAVAYRLTDDNNVTVTGEEYGDYNRSDTSTAHIILKLIKPQEMLPTHPCWNLEFKNIYYLGTTGINSDGFELDIVYTLGEGEQNYDLVTGKKFLEMFGLDRVDNNGNPTPDGVIDMNNGAILNLYSGELWFPYLRPFQYDSTDNTGKRNPNISKIYNCSAMYDSNRTDNDILSETKFKIMVSYKNRSSILNLGAMVIENSETVTLGNSTLERGKDYIIDYFSGTLTLLTSDATDPNAKLEVKYEKNQFFQLDKKTILGARAQYDFGENSYIGATALYFGQSVSDEKVEVGYEPMHNFVWDINGRYNRNLDFLTRAVNWLPLVSTNAASSFDIEGEVAQVLPNPNTLSNEETGDRHGVGFIDDFESSKRVTSPPIMRRYWSNAACPLGKDENERGFTFWFNPYGGVPTKSIWPDKEVSTTAQNNITEIMVMSVDPNWSIAVVDGVSPVQSAWGGITYAFPQSYYDQSTTKYVDIWVKGNSGTLHIDLGQISEDQVPNKKLDTEDIPDAGLTMGNGLLDPGEDTGIDGLVDKNEKIVTTKYGELSYGDTRLTEYKRDISDPHSDNWKYTEGSKEYRYINGTENNEKQTDGLFPNSEDLNNNYAIDLTNDYFTAAFDLSDPNNEYIAGKTYIDSRPTGWKLYQIPLTAFSKSATGKDISWESIRACRIWFDGLTGEDSVFIAKVELVGNEWEDLGIAKDDTSIFVVNENSFSISVINTEDNPDLYEPPAGVQGEYDEINQIRTKEQALVLNLPEEGSGLFPGEFCAAKKVLAEETSYITYKVMKLFVNGHELKADGYQFSEGEETPLQFFIRFGKIFENSPTTTNYYEYRQPIYPGWAEENEMELDLDFLTSLKNYESADDYIGEGEYQIYTNTSGVTIRHYKEKLNDAYTGREIIIYGKPSLANVKHLNIGLRNRADNSGSVNKFKTGTIKGQVWLDELRLSEVRKDKGIAYRAKASLRVADLASFDVSVNYRDADFHTVEQRPSLQTENLKTTEALTATGRISLDKFTPASWGLRLPVSGSYTQTTGTRKYIYGSDILMKENAPDSLLDISHSYGVNTSIEKRASDFWLTKYTIDQIKISANATWTDASSVTVRESQSESYKASISYNFPFPKDKYINIFKWTSSVPLIGNKLSEIRFYYFPNALTVAADAGRSESYSIPRYGTTITSSNSFGLNRNLSLGYKIFDNLSANYTLNLENDLIELWQNQWEILKSANPGQITNMRESYSVNFNPKIAKWFNPTFNYTSNFNWREPIGSNSASVDAISNQNRLTSTFSLDPSAIFSSLFKPSGTAPAPSPTPTPPGQTTGGRRATQTGALNQPKTAEPAPITGDSTRTDQKSGEKRPRKPGSTIDKGEDLKPTSGQTLEQMPKPVDDVKKPEVNITQIVAKYLKKIQPFNFNLSLNNSITNQYRTGTPDWQYRMGLTRDPGIPFVMEEYIPTSAENTSNSFDFSVRSGINLFSNVVIPLSFAQNVSNTQSQGTVSRTLTRDYIPSGINGKDGFPFPSWSLTWSQLEKYQIFSKYFKKLSLDHGFSGKESIITQNGKEMSSSYKRYFQPLIGLSMQFVNDISASARVTSGQSINNASGGTTIIDDAGASISLSWQKKGGLSIPLPFMKDKQLKNNITFSANFDYTNSTTRAKQGSATKFAVTAKSNSWKTTPRINYTFTDKVTGGLFFEYGESYNRLTGKRVTRNYGFDVNIAIRG